MSNRPVTISSKIFKKIMNIKILLQNASKFDDQTKNKEKREPKIFQKKSGYCQQLLSIPRFCSQDEKSRNKGKRRFKKNDHVLVYLSMQSLSYPGTHERKIV